MCACVRACELTRLPWLFQLSDSIGVTSRMAAGVRWFLPALFKPHRHPPLLNPPPFHPFIPHFYYFFFSFFLFFSFCDTLSCKPCMHGQEGKRLSCADGSVDNGVTPAALLVRLSSSSLSTPLSAPWLMRGWGPCWKSLQAAV